MSRRRWTSAGVVVLLTTLATAGFVTPASAHPLGNATVNHFDGLQLFPDHIADHAIEDIAEIPTLQRKSLIDTDHSGVISSAEASKYAVAQCAALAAADNVAVDGKRLPLSVASSSYGERPGAIQLSIGRLSCSLTAKVSLTNDAHVTISDNWDGAGIGWHEITVTGTDITLHNSPFPATSISDELLHYPNNLLSSPIDVRSGTISTSPGSGASTYAVTKHLPQAGFLVRGLNDIANAFNSLVGRKHVTVGAGLLALLLAMVLGAGHALLPGHGKTIMAAYLVGRRGRLRDVAAVGATVTITHTAGVLILGALISASTAFAPTEAEQDLAIVSGLMVVGIGLGLLVGAFRRRRHSDALAGLSELVSPTPALAEAPRSLVGAAVLTNDASQAGPVAQHDHDHHHPHHDHPHHDHGHDHEALPRDDHRHSHGRRTHSHGPDPDKAYSRSGLIGLGMAGGLVPSPSALLVLLATIALGRTVFGVVLVLGYGLGMAATLCVAGVMLVRLRSRLAAMATGRRIARAEWIVGATPVLTSLLVLLVGVWLTLRAVGGTV